MDQHASDEKFNFERLQREVTLNKQRLLHPLPLHLDPVQVCPTSARLPVCLLSAALWVLWVLWVLCVLWVPWVHTQPPSHLQHHPRC